MEPNRFRKQFTDAADACALAQAIVDTVREPVLVLDKDLRVIAASRSFYSVFKVSPHDTRGGPGCLNRFSASISGASAGVRLPSGSGVK